MQQFWLISRPLCIAEHRATMMVLVMIPLVVLSQFVRASMGIIAPDLANEMHVSAGELGTAASAFFIAFAILQIPVGAALDRVGGRIVLPSMLIFAIVGSLLFGAAHDVDTLIIGRALMGIGCAGLMIGSLAILKRWYSPSQFTSIMAILFACANAGSLSATLPLAAADAAWGWRAVFYGLAALSLVLGILFYSVVRDTPQPRASTAEPLTSVIVGIRDVFAVKSLAYVLPLLGIGYATSITIIGLWGVPYLHDVHGLGEMASGQAMILVGIATVLGTLAFGPLDRRFNTRSGVVIIGAAVTVVPLVMLAVAPDTSLWISLVLLIAFGFFGSYSLVVMAHGLALIPERVTGRGVAVLNTVLMGGAGAVQWASGYVVAWPSHEHAYGALFAFMAALIIGAVALYYRAGDLPPSSN